jgi:hypothetical protein
LNNLWHGHLGRVFLFKEETGETPVPRNSMRAGLTDHVWEIEGLLKLID